MAAPIADADDRHVVSCGSCGRRNRVPATAAGTPRCAHCHQPLPWLVEADDRSYASAVESRIPVLVDLWAPWCGPCRLVGPAVEQATRRFAGQLKAVKVNIDDAPQLARTLQIQGVPTLLILRGAHEVARQVGAVPAATLIEWISRHLEAAPA